MPRLIIAPELHTWVNSVRKRLKAVRFVDLLAIATPLPVNVLNKSLQVHVTNLPTPQPIPSPTTDPVVLETLHITVLQLRWGIAFGAATILALGVAIWQLVLTRNDLKDKATEAARKPRFRFMLRKASDLGIKVVDGANYHAYSLSFQIQNDGDKNATDVAVEIGLHETILTEDEVKKRLGVAQPARRSPKEMLAAIQKAQSFTFTSHPGTTGYRWSSEKRLSGPLLRGKREGLGPEIVLYMLDNAPPLKWQIDCSEVQRVEGEFPLPLGV